MRRAPLAAPHPLKLLPFGDTSAKTARMNSKCWELSARKGVEGWPGSKIPALGPAVISRALQMAPGRFP